MVSAVRATTVQVPPTADQPSLALAAWDVIAVATVLGVLRSISTAGTIRHDRASHRQQLTNIKAAVDEWTIALRTREVWVRHGGGLMQHTSPYDAQRAKGFFSWMVLYVA